VYSLKNNYTGSVTPWEYGLSSRISLLNNYIKNLNKISVLIYEYPDTSTFRYRGYNIMQITQQKLNSEWKCVYFFRNELKSIITYLKNINLITLIRVRWNQELDDFIIKAKKQNIKILFDVDDLVFDLKYLPLVQNTLNTDATEISYDFWFAYISRIEFTASKADGYITTNEYLGEKLKNKFNKKTSIIPNFINYEQLDISKDLCNQKKNIINKNPFTIGYFSGTPSHINDFKIVYKELMQLLKNFDMRLLVVGFMEFPDEMRSLINNKKIIYIPLVDFIELQRQVAQVDINIVPLVNNEFTNCKSELKYFEAAIVNTITFATPTFTYKKCIQDGKNGFLCKEGQWYERIEEFFNNVNKDEIIKNAYNEAIENYSGNKIINTINDVYNNIFE